MKSMHCKPATLQAGKDPKVVKPGAKKKRKPTPPQEPDTARLTGTCIALEPRILFDGAALATGAEVVQDTTTQDQPGVPEVNGETSTDSNTHDTSDNDALWSSGLSLSTSSDRKEIVFIDTRVENYQTLMDGIDPAAEVILLDARRDGIEQIAEALKDRSDIDAIHLIGEGTEAEMHLGTAFLTNDSISNHYAALLSQIGQSLSADADLLIYGCNFGRGAGGLSAIQALADLTRADIAASTDRTGHVSEYANWQLEISTGFIESSIVIGQATQDVWEGVLATYTVTNTNDSGAGSFRQAILDANANAGSDTINFSIAGAGPHVITLTGSELDPITGPVLIDGWSEPDFAGTPVIRIDGSSLGGPSRDGLSFTGTSDGSTVRGLMITGFSRDGILIQSGADNITVVGNWIGTTGTGSTGVGNGDDGIEIAGSNAIIGGTGANDRNVITNSGDEGITIVGSGVTGHLIQGNYIGLDPDGSTGGGNTDVGIAIITGSGNTIGGTTAAARNVISKNFEGIEINTNNNIVQGNYIGTDAGGTLNRGNRSDDGVEVQGSATGNLIGGTAAGAGNLIAFNALDGVNIVNGSSNAVLGNRIHSNSNLGIDLGTSGVTANDAGDPDTGANNLQNFPVLTSANSNTSGTTIVGTLNTNASLAYRIEFFANRPSVADASNGEGERYLGFTTVTTDGSGNASFNVTLNSVWINAGDRVTATATRDLGGGNYGDTSEFAANATATSTGIVVVDTTSDVSDGTTTSITNLGNARGADGRISLREAVAATNATGGTDTIVFNIPAALTGGAHTIIVSSALPSITEAVIIDGTTEPDFGTTPIIEIDGTSAGAGSNGLVISGTGGGSTLRGLVIQNFVQNGILLQGGNNLIAGNYIGLDADGTTTRGNNTSGTGIQGGIRIESANNTIGGLVAADRNVISGNIFSGIALAGAGATGNQIRGNYIGTDAGGTLDRGNTQEGIEIDNADGNTIGGSAAGAQNVISGNDSDGIEIDNGDNNIIQGNYIGTDYTGTLDLGNSRDGIDLNEDTGDGATGNLIGGTGANEGNLIFGNDLHGIEVRDAPTTGNAILGNRIYGNTLRGINLEGGTEDGFGVTANDAGDGDAGANDLQNFPVLTTADVDSPTQVTIDGTFNSTASSTFRIEFYKNTIATGQDPSSHGEGQTYLGFTSVTTDGSGNGTFNTTLTASVTAGEFVTATATRDLGGGNYGSTSEFALNATATAVNDIPVIANLGGDTLAYTEGDGAQVIDQSGNAAVSDVDSADFDTGTLTVSFQAGSDAAEDVLAIRDQGAGPTNITVAGSAVSYGGTQIGTFTGGSGGTDLVITLDANADSAAVSALVQNITYENTDTDNPTLGSRTVRYVLTDGDGGTSANYDTTVTISSQNDAPVLTPASPTLTTITEDDTTNSGDLVSTIVGASITDVDSGAVEGIAITGLTSGNGTWEYDIGGGWTAVGAVSDVSALLLRSTDSLRFVPDGQNADSATVTYRAWDQTSGTEGTKVDASTNGGTTAFSTATDTASITVTAVNDAPVLTPASPTLTTITEDDTSNSGDLVSAIVGSSIADVDSGAVEGIAITGLTSGNGTWEYDIGSGWTAVGAVSDATALLLRSTDSLRFVPDGLNADSATVTYRAWDQTSGTEGTKVDASTNGGTTAFSTATDTATITVTAVNDAPAIITNGGGPTAALTRSENITAVTTVTATDVDVPADTLQYSIIGGADMALFSIGSGTGVLVFNAAPDFEAPGDADTDNVYEVTVQVSDGNGGFDTQAISVTVVDNVGTLTVDTTSDTADGDTSSIAALLADKGFDGFISLREAIIATNNTGNDGAADQINFNIAGAGPHTISPSSALTTLTDVVVIDGYTQAGSSANTLATGNDGVLQIELNGTGAGSANGLTLGSGSAGSTIKGLIINRFSLSGIQLSGANNVVVGNWIGLDNTGAVDQGNAIDGITITANNNTIGSAAAADRNVISGNNDEGVDVDPGISGTVIQGNYIGTNISGTAAVGNGQVGVGPWGGIIVDGSNNTIGGSNTGEGNLISGNNQWGVWIIGTGNRVLGNKIGTDAAGTVALGNVGDGIQIATSSNKVGGVNAGEGNLIAHNTNNGVNVTGGTNNSILGNQIHSNTGLGIELGSTGVTVNDAGDADAGANDLQNFPVLATADVDSPTQVTIDGTFNSTASSSFRVEFFKNTTATGEDPSGHGEGQTYLGFTSVTTDGSGNGSFNLTLNASVTTGEFVTATATEDLGGGNYGSTSEFSLNTTAVAENDAPVLTPSSPTLTTITEDDTSNSGHLVSAIVGASITDVDTGAVEGIAITALTSGNGTWEYDIGGGWTAVGAVSDDDGLLDGDGYGDDHGDGGQ
ncbi:DUF4347 domain-containing protein [Candidatus Nitrospira neomarina]|uniref:DUF4347 domain-containing protein n=1 Tax=Candidatus Nitrospira neomarina TaxID=3020899 RepID=A0AA96K4Z0_9BACT|nr:DUF4347 domain-containing protein [Candidatus Nitrospira neomarina]WNM63854.1 DUF4347 domain-containing protein [Candidatus Nitrospira neomarina]